MTINFKHKVSAKNIEEVKIKVIEQFKTLGFGMLTEINFSQKLKEKLDVTIPETLILGACNPKLAYEVYQKSTDFLSLVPCNIVIRNIDHNIYSVEVIKPSDMVKVLDDKEINQMSIDIDQDIEKLIKKIL